MAIRLINKQATKVIDISGTQFHICQINGADKANMSLMMIFDKDGNGVGNFNSMMPIIARGVVKIEGYEDRKVIDVLSDMADAMDISKLLSEIVKFSSLTEDERKNSPSSPPSNLQESKQVTVGSVAPITPQRVENIASTITKPLPLKDQPETLLE